MTCASVWSFSSPMVFGLAVLLSTAAGQEATVGSETANPDRPNIVLIMADDLGYGDLGCYGQKLLKTPAIDALAAAGRRYTDFYAGSTVCAPSRCVLMTGKHTGHCYIRGNSGLAMPPSETTVAKVLQDAGYSTGLFGKWGLGREGSIGMPTSHGFDVFFGYLSQRHAHNYWPEYLVRGDSDGVRRVALENVVPKAGKEGQGEATEKFDYSHDRIMAEAKEWLQSVEGPFFCYLPITLPHANNEARSSHGMEVPDYGEFAEQDWPAAEKGFASMMQRVDQTVADVSALLAKRGLDDNTILIFTSDNGPHREGRHDPDFFRSRGGLKGIKRALTEGGIRVPFIVRWPGVVPAGTESADVGGFQDLLPTLADCAGVGAPECDGISLLPTWRGQGEERMGRVLYWAFYERGGAQAIRFGHWKAVEQPKGSPIRLYDLAKDPGESTDLAARHPELVDSAKRRMAAQFEPSKHFRFRKARRKRGRTP